MNKFILTIIAVALCNPLISQSSIEQSEFPVVSDSRVMYIVDSNYNVLADEIGSSITWDFSQIGGYIAVPVQNTEYQAFGNAAFGSNFSTCDQMWSTTGYMEISQYTNNNQLFSKGFGFNISGVGDVVLILDDSVKFFDFPLEYGNSDVNGTYAGILQNPYTTDAPTTGVFTSKVDGDGTLLLPNGVSYSNVIRTTTWDSAHAVTLFGNIDVVRTERVYYQDGGSSAEPLFITVRFTVYALGSILRDDQILFSSENPSNAANINSLNISDFSLYPNPTKSKVTIKGDISNSSITLLDMTGKQLIFVETKNSNSVVINVEELKTGIYFAQIKKGTQVITKKLVIE
jgi:hypothetical protein